MTWKEIRLTQRPLLLRFDDGVCAKLYLRSRQTPGGTFSADLVVAFDAGPAIHLEDAVDNGETTPEARVFAVSGTQPSKVFLIGGPKAYRISSSGSVEQTTDLWRRWEDSEYWSTEFLEAASGVLIVYEAGVLLLSEHLDVKWHQKKYFNDSLSGVEGNAVKFLRDHDQEWAISLNDGAVS
jgi:hypothetical protein